MGRLAMIVTLSRTNPLYCYTQSVIIHDLFFITPKYARSGQLGLDGGYANFSAIHRNHLLASRRKNVAGCKQ
jgi:hypothetical protein